MAQLEILLSQVKELPFDFEAAVREYIAALEAHRFTTEGEAAPGAVHPLVEHAVRRVQYPTVGVHQPTHTYVNDEGETVTEPIGEPVRFVSSEKPDDFVPNYAIVDDTPSLDERKITLANALATEASKLTDEILPPLKRRLWEMQYSEALKSMVLLRSAAQNATITQHEARTDRVQEIYRHLAQMHSDIHDLTDATFDDWKPAPFPV